ncbi:hypothetical protein D3C77_409650 [compost metagenome]
MRALQTIIIKLNPTQLQNPELDLRYLVPDAIEEYTNRNVTDQGYDYLDDEFRSMCIWLSCEDAHAGYVEVVKCLTEQKILDNDILLAAEIYVGEIESADIEQCTLVHKPKHI